MNRARDWMLMLCLSLISLSSIGQTGSLTDIDDDNDGILDIVENRGYEPFSDADNDGILNYKDSTHGCPTAQGRDIYGRPYSPLIWRDCNSDGINDFFDWDRDGIISELDLDSDNDGIVDIAESRDARATDINRDGMADGADIDGDGLRASADANDNDPSPEASRGLFPQDLDRDLLPNYTDLDSDGDGLADNREALQLDAFAGGYAGLTLGMNDADKDGVRTINYTNNNNDADNFVGFGAKGIIVLDNDGDGFPNPYDVDSDSDGITDNVEGQPTCSYVEPSGEDADADGLDDAYDFDKNECSRKAAGITPYDKDFDGTPDIRDLDTDNDGAPDVNEGSGIYTNFVTDYDDKDGDGLIDIFDGFDIVAEGSKFCNNVCHNEMGAGGTRNGPTPGGSRASLPQMAVGECPGVDRDWRNVSILPVSLISFAATVSSKQVQLRWAVTNELNMSSYVVERSYNGSNFEAVLTMAARGNRTGVTLYDALDVPNWNAGIVYYRLRELDKDGTFKISRVLVLRLDKKNDGKMAVFPNPASTLVNVQFEAARQQVATVRILDVTGRVAMQQRVSVKEGSNVIALKNDLLATGTYTLQVITEENNLVQQIVIRR